MASHTEINSDVRGFQSVEERGRYGSKTLDPLASDNPDCLWPDNVFFAYPPRKQFFAFQQLGPETWMEESILEALRGIYEGQIHPALLHILESHGVWAQFRELHPVRTGFDIEEGPKPVTLVIVFEHGSVSVDVAKAIVTEIKVQLLPYTSWPSEIPIYVDVCERSTWFSDEEDRAEASVANTDPLAMYKMPKDTQPLFKAYPYMYEDARPLPGASIGLENLRSTATGSCYVRHGSDTYMVTNAHAVHPNKGESPYRYVPGNEKHSVLSPSPADHETILSSINRKISRSTPGTEAEERWKAFLTKAQNYNRYLGFVVATSGFIAPLRGGYRQDWALIKCEEGYEYVNRHRRHGSNDEEILQLEQVEPFMVKAGVDESWILETENHFRTSPLFNGVSPNLPKLSDPYYLKPPSARSGFKAAVCNGLMHTLTKHGRGGITREWAFMSPLNTEIVSRSGDSGSCILDRKYKIVAMLWGGCMYQEKNTDITFATPFTSVLRDIESRMGWEPESLKLL